MVVWCLLLGLAVVGLAGAQTPEEIAFNEVDTGGNFVQWMRAMEGTLGKEDWKRHMWEMRKRGGREKRSVWVEQLRREWEATERQRALEDEQERRRQLLEDAREREEETDRREEVAALAADPDGMGFPPMGGTPLRRPQYPSQLGSQYPSQFGPPYPSQFGSQHGGRPIQQQFPTQIRPQYSPGPQQGFGGYQDGKNVPRRDDGAWLHQMRRETENRERQRSIEEERERARMMEEERRTTEEIEDEMEAKEIERVYGERDRSTGYRVKRSDWRAQLAKEREEREKQKALEEEQEHERRQLEDGERAAEGYGRSLDTSRWVQQWYQEKDARDRQKAEEDLQESQRLQREYAGQTYSQGPSQPSYPNYY